MADLVCPDILVLGKALTGGYIGHAVTVANHKVYQGFYGDDPSLALMHGPTFMGNALACSVALKSIELFESEDYMAKISRIAAITRREMEGFEDSRIKEVRMMGGCLPGRTAVCGSGAVCLMDSADSLAGAGRLLPGFDEQGEKVVPPYGFR